MQQHEVQLCPLGTDSTPGKARGRKGITPDTVVCKKKRKENTSLNGAPVTRQRLQKLFTDLDQLDSTQDGTFPASVSKLVLEHRNMDAELNSPTECKVTIADLSDTIYKVKDLNAWEKFYLPHIVKMQVFGIIVDGCVQFVLMTCQDKKVYLFDGEELHEVASSLKQLRQKGINYPGSKVYCYGDAFKHMTLNDWEEVKRGDVGQKLDKEQEELVLKHKEELLKNLLRQQ